MQPASPAFHTGSSRASLSSSLSSSPAQAQAQAVTQASSSSTSSPSTSVKPQEAPDSLEGLSTSARYLLLASGSLRFAPLQRTTQEVPSAWKGVLAGGAIGDLGEPRQASLYDQRVSILRTLRQTLVERWGSAQAVTDALRFGSAPHFRQARDLLVLANDGNECAVELASRPIDVLEAQLVALSKVVRYYDGCAMRVATLVDAGEVRHAEELSPADTRGFAYALRQHRLSSVPVEDRPRVCATFHRSVEAFLAENHPKGATPLQVAAVLTQVIAKCTAQDPAAGQPAEAKSKVS